MSEVNLDQDTAIQQAVESGCTAVRCGQQTLMIDLDNYYGMQNFLQRVNDVESDLNKHGRLQILAWESWISKSGRGVHVLLTLDAEVAYPHDLIIIQGYLGSDLKRDFLTLMQIWHGMEDSRLLFRPNTAKGVKGEGAVRGMVSSMMIKLKPSMPEIDEDDIPF